MTKNKRVLFILPTNIGDFVLSTSILKFFENKNENYEFYVLGGKLPIDLVKYHPMVKEVYLNEEYRGKKKIYLLKKWRKIYWDTVVDVKNTLFPFFLKAEHKYFKLFNNKKTHAVYNYLSIVKKREIPGFFLYIPDEALKNADSLFRRIPDNSFLIGINPDANWDKKRWPAHRFLKLMEILKKSISDAFFIITGLKAHIKELPEFAIDISGKTDLLTLAAVIKRLNVFISNDSGPMHLSAALGIKTFGVFGPSLPERYAPIGINSYFYKNTKLCKKKCFITKCPYDFWCLKNTFPEDIAALVLKYLNSSN